MRSCLKSHTMGQVWPVIHWMLRPMSDPPRERRSESVEKEECPAYAIPTGEKLLTHLLQP